MSGVRSQRLAGLVLMVVATLCFAEEPAVIQLPPPQMEGGTPLMQTLHERKSRREFTNDKLTLQELSNLLWAAFGINRPSAGGRTAPSARDWQVIDVYAATGEGIYLYDAKAQALRAVVQGDLRALTGTQDFVKDAAVNLIYVADFARMGSDLQGDERKIAAAADAGFIGQNVYLYCASANLATVVRGSIDKEPLAKAMKLRSTQWIVLAQSVGQPKK